jgi:cytochrome P450
MAEDGTGLELKDAAPASEPAAAPRRCPVVPPRPASLDGQASLMQLMRIGLRSAIGIHTEHSYEDTRVGRSVVRTLPKGSKRTLFTVRTPDLVREVLVRRAEEFPKSQLMDDMLRALTGYSIFTSNGEDWRRHRRLMDPAFEGARIAGAFPMMSAAVDACLERLGAHADRRGSRPMAVDTEMTHLAADIIFRTIFSEAMGPKEALRFFSAFNVFQEIAYAHGMLQIVKFPTWLLPGHYRAKLAAVRIREILHRPLRRRLRKARAGEAVPTNDILSSMMTTVDPVTGTRFDDAELLNQISMLFLAGHETSATAMAWALYLLALDPEMQERVHAEAVRVYSDDEPAFHHMKRLSLTRDVFREAMRLYPPVAVVARDATKAEKITNRAFTPGSIVFVPPWLMHRHTAHWDNPHAFDPDRFSTPNGQEAARCAYFPFSMGPRVCAGAAFALQEGALLLSQAVRRFRFRLVEGHTPDPVARLTLRSANGIPLIVERRAAA